MKNTKRRTLEVQKQNPNLDTIATADFFARAFVFATTSTNKALAVTARKGNLELGVQHIRVW